MKYEVTVQIELPPGAVGRVELRGELREFVLDAIRRGSSVNPGSPFFGLHHDDVRVTEVDRLG